MVVVVGGCGGVGGVGWEGGARIFRGTDQDLFRVVESRQPEHYSVHTVQLGLGQKCYF